MTGVDAAGGSEAVRIPKRTRWERRHPIRAGRLWRCRALGLHNPQIIDGGRKRCPECFEWTETGR